MKQLSKDLIAGDGNAECFRADHLSEKVVQFGEGNFLRGFVDWMIHQTNKQQLFNGRVVAIQPTPHGKVVPKLEEQDGLYTFVMRGVEHGQEVDKSEVISSIARGINPYTDWQRVLEVAENPAIEVMFSNTTEAGLTYMAEEYRQELSPLSFPGKVTAFLHHRYKAFNGSDDAGLLIVPCELVEDNGTVLKELVIRIAREWDFPEDFVKWAVRANQFCNSLVDRIVTGFPKENSDVFFERLGYQDVLLTVGEPYHLFAIEAGSDAAELLPFTKAGLNVKWGDSSIYRDLKVRLLNGAHTMMFAASYLAGRDTVLEVMRDETLLKYVETGMNAEIMPYLDVEEQEKQSFAASVLERFRNPYTRHMLTDIGMNAVYKFRARVMPSLLAYVRREGTLPRMLVFSLAALIIYYRPVRRDGDFLIGSRQRGEEYVIRDNAQVIECFYDAWTRYEEDTVRLTEVLLQQKELWGINVLTIAGLKEALQQDLTNFMQYGARTSLERLLKDT
ncbi:tagaturonate reductase [Alkalihalobacillus oceani]|uniref:tagaturonate reductase n=1 Tax=Halalkalibacter oceani TaxID=1653776 RepID=UPI00203B0447|nr:tagaturonate reductase [Halalkalibacter oceani]MCM3761118.1 tagaturonate reductase [Halalkalibacter oceani]